MVKKVLGILLILLSTLTFAQDRSRKAYEFIYQDVQLLRQQILQLEEKIEQNTEDLRLIKDQVKELAAQFKLFQSEQARFQGDLKNIPSQYHVLYEKLQQINLQLLKITEEILAMRGISPVPSEEEQKIDPEHPEAKPTAKPETKETQAEEKTPLQPTLPPQDFYNMAYSDYLKGSFALAIDGFKLYMEQFPESPLADNALYWIGECYFSQKKFAEAIYSFDDLILHYPRGDKVAAAHLKKGISLMELGKKEEALSVFKLLISKYPLEEEAKIAQEKIKELLEKK